MRFNSSRQFCISLWNTASTLQSPKGMWSHLKKTQVTYCEGGVLFQCLLQFYLPEPRFKVQAGKMSSTYQIAPDSSISHRWFQTSSTRGRGICLNHSLNGVSSVTFITCLVEWVQPNSGGPTKTCHGTQPRAGKQHLPAPEAKSLTHSNPVHQIVFHAFAWQSNWGYEDPGVCPPSCNWASMGGLGSRITATALATEVFFQRSVGKLYCSLPPWLPSYFLASTLCMYFVWWGLQQRAIFSP